MSYDIDVGTEWFNYTSNMHRFFADFGVYPPDFHGLLASQVRARIDAALSRIVTTSVADLDEYNAPNGWGKWQNAVPFLMSVRDACLANPAVIVEESH